MQNLSRFTFVLFSCLFLLQVGPQNAQAQDINVFYDAVDSFMGKYVSEGLVDYEAVKNEPAQIDALLAQIATLDRTSLSPEDEQAYLVNVYNVLIIKNIIDHYPTASPTAENGFFDGDKFQVSGKSQTLDEVEKGDLYVKYPDARFHFVLVCAALGCPQLIEQAYRGSTLDEQLTRQTQLSLNDDFYLNVEPSGDKVNVSELFSWYKSDFERDGGSVIGFINKFRKEQLPENISIGYITYDWQLNDGKKKIVVGDNLSTPESGLNSLLQGENLQAFTPSTLLVRGQVDVKVFNNLYTQTAFFNDSGSRTATEFVDENGSPTGTDRRDTYFTSIISILVGVSPRINLGLDLYPKAVRVASEGKSPFSVLQFSSDNNSHAALAAIAPKIKFNPLKKVPGLAAQATLYLPLGSDLEGSQNSRPFLDYDDTQFWLQAFYDLPINDQWLLYIEGGFFFRYDSSNENRNHEYIYPFKGIVNYLATDRLTIYGLTELTPSSFYQDAALFSTLYTQVGAGLKYQVTPRFEIETLATVFPFGYNKGAGQTYNFGFRYVR